MSGYREDQSQTDRGPDSGCIKDQSWAIESTGAEPRRLIIQCLVRTRLRAYRGRLTSQEHEADPIKNECHAIVKTRVRLMRTKKSEPSEEHVSLQ